MGVGSSLTDRWAGLFCPAREPFCLTGQFLIRATVVPQFLREI